MNVAVIPARGGSKRIPRKNIKQFCGKPIIAWPIEVAKQSELFDHILVSTDDEEIAKVAKSCGAEVPFLRPAKLSDDYAGTTEVIAHAVSWMHEQQWQPKAVCCIYATSVFFIADDLKKGFDALNTGNWSYAFSATDFEYPIFRSFRDHPDGGVEMFFPEHYHSRSQDLPQAYHDAGQFGWGWKNSWNEENIGFGKNSTIIELPRWRVVDIDTEEDWKHAEIVYRIMKNK